jgi:hypothetical protein
MLTSQEPQPPLHSLAADDPTESEPNSLASIALMDRSIASAAAYASRLASAKTTLACWAQWSRRRSSEKFFRFNSIKASG